MPNNLDEQARIARNTEFFQQVQAAEKRAGITASIPSPEETGHYECPACRNRERFTGIDARGWGGGEDCECDGDEYVSMEFVGGRLVTTGEYPANYIDGHAPDCPSIQPCELTQDFDVLSQNGTRDGADLSYDSHEGGGSGAEIGSYTTILCRDCDATVWTEG